MLLTKNSIKKESFFKKKYKELCYKIKNIRNTNIEVGLCHYYMNNIFDATIRFKLILKFRPQDIEALYNLGRCYIKRKKFQKAMSIFQKIMDRHKMARYEYEKMVSPEQGKIIPNAIINEKLHHMAIYKIYHGYTERYLQKIITESIYKHCETEKKLNILETFCQNGYIATSIKKRGIDCDITGTDITYVATEHCNDLLINNNEKVYKQVFVKTSSTILAEYNNLQYEVVIGLEHLSHFYNLNKTFKKIRLLLADNGIAIVSLFSSNSTDSFELDEINDVFCFNVKYIEDVAKRSGLVIYEQYNSKNNLFINNNLIIFVIGKNKI